MSTVSLSGSPSGVWSARSGSARSSGPKNIDPPRPAKNGFEWVWFPEGYWAERPLEQRMSSRDQGQRRSLGPTSPAAARFFRWPSRASRSPKPGSRFPAPGHEQSRQVSPTSHPRDADFLPPKNLPQSPYLSESEQVAALQHPTDPPSPPGLHSGHDTWTSFGPTTTPIDELLSQDVRAVKDPPISKAAWRLTHRHMAWKPAESPEGQPHAEAEPTVENVPSYFSQKPSPFRSHPAPQQAKKDRSRIIRDLSPTPSQASAASTPRGLRKWLMKFPRSRKVSASSAADSITSSIYQEKWPNTPSSESINESIVAFNRPVHIPGSTGSYPAGKAMHVETPPLKQQTASGNPRSLFLDIKHTQPLEDDAGASFDSRKTAPWVASYRKEQPHDQREWWEAPVRGEPARHMSYFEFDLPEHLPSSPMCPANPKHKGKGKLVCVYHGRGKQASNDQSDETEESD